MKLASTAHIQFRPGGLAQIEAALRLTGNSLIQCCHYPDHPPILSLRDQHVSVTIGTPSTSVLTVDDLEAATRLAEALADYIAELRSRLACYNHEAAHPG